MLVNVFVPNPASTFFDGIIRVYADGNGEKTCTRCGMGVFYHAYVQRNGKCDPFMPIGQNLEDINITIDPRPLVELSQPIPKWVEEIKKKRIRKPRPRKRPAKL